MPNTSNQWIASVSAVSTPIGDKSFNGHCIDYFATKTIMEAAQAIAYLQTMNMDYKLTELNALVVFGCGALDSLGEIKMMIPLSLGDGPLVLHVDLLDTELPAFLGIKVMHPLAVLIYTGYCALILRRNG